MSQQDHPITHMRWVPVEQVEPNDYNPNSVASKEMKLLYTSIKHDGYTQPVVTIWDEQRQKYIIVDGFHRYFTCKNNEDIKESTGGCIPIVVIEKDINERMAATVRHNRARGAHSVSGMSNMVFNMLDNGWELSHPLAIDHPMHELVTHLHLYFVCDLSAHRYHLVPCFPALV